MREETKYPEGYDGSFGSWCNEKRRRHGIDQAREETDESADSWDSFKISEVQKFQISHFSF